MKKVGKKRKGCDCGEGDCGDCGSGKIVTYPSPACNQRVGKNFKQCTTQYGISSPPTPSPPSGAGSNKPTPVPTPTSMTDAQSNTGGSDPGDGDNGDGGDNGGGNPITPEEFLAMLDTDGDGFIDSDEWNVWRDQLNDLIASGEYDPLFDMNGDGEITTQDRVIARATWQQFRPPVAPEAEELEEPDRLVKGKLLSPMDVNEYVKKRDVVMNKRKIGKKQKYSASNSMQSDPGSGGGGTPVGGGGR